MELKLNIREFRTRRGLTLQELADRVGVSTPHLSEVERGKKNLNNHLLVRIASALNVSPDALIASENRADIDDLLGQLNQLSEDDVARVRAFVHALNVSR